MNKKGNKNNLVARHPGNLNALKSGAHSPRMIQARADEIMETFEGAEQLDDAGKVHLAEVARLKAIIELIDQDLAERGLVDKEDRERYLVRRRESYSRRLIEVTDRLLASQKRSAARENARNLTDDSVGRRAYVRGVEEIALGCDADARVSDRLNALKALIEWDYLGKLHPRERLEVHIPERDWDEAAERRRIRHELETMSRPRRLMEDVFRGITDSSGGEDPSVREEPRAS